MIGFRHGRKKIKAPVCSDSIFFQQQKKEDYEDGDGDGDDDDDENCKT